MPVRSAPMSKPSESSELPEPSDPSADAGLFDRIVNLSKRRGFVFPSAEIYGGFRSTYDYGPVGVLMLRNVKDAWWRSMVQLRDDVVGLDAAILSPSAIWEASGHLATFTDPLVDCRNCGTRHRLDKLEDPDVCPTCGQRGTFTEPRQFNLMFKTNVGPVEDAGSVAYLRPETAQGIFVNFVNVMNASRKKPPFGIAQIGKSFRNEITPGNFVFRTREFEQMEMEFFVPPDEGVKWYEYWCQERHQWYLELGIPADMLRLRPHAADELSHYSIGTSDVEFTFPWGWDELEGIAQRTDFDLTKHSEHSGVRLDYFDQATGTRYTPYVIEPAAGATRTMMAFLMAAYDEEEVRGETRTVLRLHPRLAPYKVAVLPLSRKPELSGPARDLLKSLQPHFMCEYDETQAIGRRYRRQDELGTPYCVTFDFDSLHDHAVTVRDRDTMAQDRVSIADLVDHLDAKLDL
jgi:glycyl-tRNA synthetase